MSQINFNIKSSLLIFFVAISCLLLFSFAYDDTATRTRTELIVAVVVAIFAGFNSRNRPEKSMES
ncbi:hypothetical protein [Thalassotalea fusca]